MGLLEPLLRDPLRPDRVAALDLVGVPDLLAGELAGDDLQPAGLRAEVRPVGLVGEAPCVRDERGRVAERLLLDALGELRGPK